MEARKGVRVKGIWLAASLGIPALLCPLRPSRTVAPSVAMDLRLGDTGAVLSTGSGAIIHPRGYLVTSSHVLGSGEGRLCARLPDPDHPFRAPAGRLYGLSLVRQSARYDLALLKIVSCKNGGRSVPLPPGRRFPYLEFGVSRDAEPLDRLYAFGFPVLSRIDSEAASGISALAGRVSGVDRQRGWIKAVLSASPGFSGGPVRTIRGDLLGIVTAVKLDRESHARLTLIRLVHLLGELLEGTPPGRLFFRTRLRD